MSPSTMLRAPRNDNHTTVIAREPALSSPSGRIEERTEGRQSPDK